MSNEVSNGQEPGGEAPLPCPILKETTASSFAPFGVSEANRRAAERGAWVLEQNVSAMIRMYGIERIGFLTLTFPYNEPDRASASARWHSFNTNVISGRYLAWVRVAERHHRGGIHYHLLVVLRDDIRSGVDFRAFDRRDYRSASPALRAEWRFLRDTLKLYGFGRHQLYPLISDHIAIADYVGKYLTKSCGAERPPEDKGWRLVAYSRGWRVVHSRVSIPNYGALCWRYKVRLVARDLWLAGRIKLPSLDSIEAAYGAKWTFRLGELVQQVPLPPGGPPGYLYKWYDGDRDIVVPMPSRL